MTDNRKARSIVRGAIEQSSLTLGAHARKVIEHGLANAVVAGELVAVKTDAGIRLLTADEVRKHG